MSHATQVLPGHAEGSSVPTPDIEVDLLVVGGGMAGLTTAGRAAGDGRSVLLVEKADHLGGNAALSGGFLWTAKTYDELRSENPLGDPELGRVLIEGSTRAIEWVQGLGIETSEQRTSSTNPYGAGRLIDILGYLDRCRHLVAASGGIILLGAEVDSLIQDGDRVWGGRVRDRDGQTVVKARATVLTTGGFQADGGLRKEFIGPEAEGMLLRSNPYSDGAGLRLGLQVGAARTDAMNGFYGHVIASPLTREFLPGDYLRLAQSIYSMYGVLLDRNGDRFTDESLGHFKNAQALVRLPGARAVLIADERVRREKATQPPLAGMETIDLPREAAGEGANVAFADTIEDLAAAVAPWGFNAARIAESIRGYNAKVEADADSMQPGRKRNRIPVVESPFVAVEVQPAITFTHGGLRIDASARVLHPDGTPIPGLLAAGADGAGVFNGGYAGGLMLATVFGMLASDTAKSA
jgi:succinate dehydrogenase/fumarate reductase flavoprotein subunit